MSTLTTDRVREHWRKAAAERQKPKPDNVTQFPAPGRGLRALIPPKKNVA